MDTVQHQHPGKGESHTLLLGQAHTSQQQRLPPRYSKLSRDWDLLSKADLSITLSPNTDQHRAVLQQQAHMRHQQQPQHQHNSEMSMFHMSPVFSVR